MIRTVAVRRHSESEQTGEPEPPTFGVPYRAEWHPADIEEEVAADRARARLGFFGHAGVYLGVMLLLAVINLLQSPERLWFVWPLFGWAVALAAHALTVFAFGPGGSLERAFIARELRQSH